MVCTAVFCLTLPSQCWPLFPRQQICTVQDGAQQPDLTFPRRHRNGYLSVTAVAMSTLPEFSSLPSSHLEAVHRHCLMCGLWMVWRERGDRGFLSTWTFHHWQNGQVWLINRGKKTRKKAVINRRERERERERADAKITKNISAELSLNENKEKDEHMHMRCYMQCSRDLHNRDWNNCPYELLYVTHICDMLQVVLHLCLQKCKVSSSRISFDQQCTSPPSLFQQSNWRTQEAVFADDFEWDYSSQ